MTKEEVIKFCLSLNKSTNDFPFDEEVMVFRIGGKIFALINIKSDDTIISLKCDPVLAELLRGEFRGVKPGYHLNKKHWNSVDCNSDLNDEKLCELIEHSYKLVLKGLKKSIQNEINEITV